MAATSRRPASRYRRPSPPAAARSPARPPSIPTRRDEPRSPISRSTAIPAGARWSSPPGLHGNVTSTSDRRSGGPAQRRLTRPVHAHGGPGDDRRRGHEHDHRHGEGRGRDSPRRTIGHGDRDRNRQHPLPPRSRPAPMGSRRSPSARPWPRHKTISATSEGVELGRRPSPWRRLRHPRRRSSDRPLMPRRGGRAATADRVACTRGAV